MSVKQNQMVRLDGDFFSLDDGEAICAEYSHKYTVDGFFALVAEVGLTLRHVWTDDRKLSGVLNFVIGE